MYLDEILKAGVDSGASDVHLSPLTPPIIPLTPVWLN